MPSELCGRDTSQKCEFRVSPASGREGMKQMFELAELPGRDSREL